MSTVPPGWHPDPSDPRRLRWWDGTMWTEHVHAPAPQPQPATIGAAAPAVAQPGPSPAAFNAGGAAPGTWGAQTGPQSGPSSAGSGDTLATVSLVSGLLWVLYLGSVTAIVTGIMALRRTVTGGARTRAIAGITLGALAFLAFPLMAAVAIPVFLNQREMAWEASLHSEVRNGAIAMEESFTENGAYPVGEWMPVEQITSHYTPGDEDVEVHVVWTMDDDYCLEGSHRMLEEDRSIAYHAGSGGFIDQTC